MDRNSRALHCYRAFMTKVEWLVIAAIVLILAALIVPAIDRATAEHVSVGSVWWLRKCTQEQRTAQELGSRLMARAAVQVVVSILRQRNGWLS